MKSVKPALLRGYILDCLYAGTQGNLAPDMDNPNRIPKTILEEVFKVHGSHPPDDDIAKALHYLKTKTFINVGWASDGTGDWYWAEITTKGIDLVEGKELEPGVRLGGR